MKNPLEQQPKVTGIEKGLELQEKKQQEKIQHMRDSIERVTVLKGKYEEWKKAAEDEGDEKSALLYETEILEADVIICELEMQILEREMRIDERWQSHYNHLMEMDLKRDSEEYLEQINNEFEHISEYIEFLLEEENLSEENKQKIQELQKRKEVLETERLKY